MTSDEWKDAHWLSHKWQHRTIDGRLFFGPSDSMSKWANRSDYPIRYFLWKTNRDVWADFDQWRCGQAQILSAAKALQEALATLSLEISGESDFDPEASIEWSFRQSAVAELDADEELLDCLDEGDTIDLIGAELGTPLTWQALGSLLALLHISDCVKHLEAGDMGMAGAFAIKAQMWQSNGRYQAGRISSEQMHKKRLAESGADAAHQENRRLRAVAIEAFLSGSWPSKMQAARVISKQVNRTELVVLRWIREHTRIDPEEGVTLPAE